MYGTRAVRDASGAEHKYTSGVSPREGYFLYDLVRRNGVRRALEVGMAFGTSALYICEGMRAAGEGTAADGTVGNHGSLTSIDPFQSTQWHGIGQLNLERAELTALHQLIEEPSHFAMPKLLEAGEQFDLVFIDGMHLFDYTLLDVFYATKLLRQGGVLVIDDARHRGVADALRYIDTNYTKMLRRIGDAASRDTMATYIKVAEDAREWNEHTAFSGGQRARGPKK